MMIERTTNREGIMSKSFSVIFRAGGTDNFKWNLVGERFATSEAAAAKKADLERMGYPSLVHDAAMLASIGMPETYE